MKIAVLGLGRMGHAVAERLHQGGHDLTVWNRTKGRGNDLVGAGATEAASAARAVATADVAISCLSDDGAVRELTLEGGGMLAALEGRPYVDASTVSPLLSAELAHAHQSFMALPILGAPQAVRDGKATYLAGGDAAVIDQVRPMLDSLGGRLKCYDLPEKASTAKLAVNLLLLSGLATLAESVALARAGGLTDGQLIDLLEDSPMVAPGLHNRFSALVDGSGPAWWTTVLGAKDARLAVDAAAAEDISLRIAPVVRDLYQAAADAGLEGEDIVAVARLYR